MSQARLGGRPLFDASPAGCHAYSPSVAEQSTGRGGEADVAFLPPEGAIAFTGQ